MQLCISTFSSIYRTVGIRTQIYFREPNHGSIEKRIRIQGYRTFSARSTRASRSGLPGLLSSPVVLVPLYTCLANSNGLGYCNCEQQRKLFSRYRTYLPTVPTELLPCQKQQNLIPTFNIASSAAPKIPLMPEF